MTRAPRLALGTRIERQLEMTDPEQMLAEISTHCDIGAKRSSKGNTMCWRGYKLRLDVADGGIPISTLLTSASVHDSQVAIPMMRIISKRVTCLFDVRDSACDAAAIYQASAKLNHRPIIQPHTGPKPKTQLSVRLKPSRKCRQLKISDTNNAPPSSAPILGSKMSLARAPSVSAVLKKCSPI
jgi:hypothetical protein